MCSDELFLLMRRWSRALEGEGQFIQIVGEPGIGKSRLIEEFRAKLAETPHTWVEWAASQLLQNTPLHPLAEWGRLRFRTISRSRKPGQFRPQARRICGVLVPVPEARA
jgi:predicted ATPase